MQKASQTQSGSRMNGADILTDTLLANGVDVCFANPGTSEMHFVAALDRKPEMRCILGLFEGVVTGAADGYARMLEKPAATLLHTGPGLANGLANIHNAKRAQTPMVNIIGDHASYHLAYDAPLTSDIESLAKPMSHWVQRVESLANVSRDAAKAIAVANTAPGKIASLILPADMAWSNVAEGTHSSETVEIIRTDKPLPLAPDASAITRVAQTLRANGVNAENTTILLTGRALRTDALNIANKISQATGARLLAQQANGRAERGAGRVPIDRVPYSVDLALKLFANTQRIILVGSKAPVGFFAYPGKPSSMLPATCEVLELVSAEQDVFTALQQLADQLPSAPNTPSKSALVAPRDDARLHSDMALQARLSPTNISQIVAALIPEGAIVCEEAVSSGRDIFPTTWASAPHDWIQVTGGAIGLGLPMALGAAIACPSRKVIDLQADGSGMYTLQALWTMARERCDVLVLVYANRRYNILLGELKAVGAGGAEGKPGYNASRMLDLVDPSLDWVSLARGMGVDAARVETPSELIDLMRSAIRRKGPFLIEMMID
jgi:acetolactate synthase I/II/III large subunit